MKHAELWKRILNEGVKGKTTDLIITSPIIVDSRPRDELAEEGTPWNWDQFKALAVPFDRFWVEGTSVATDKLNAGGNFGALVEVRRVSDSTLLGMTAIITAPNAPLIHFGTLSVFLKPNGDLDTRYFDEKKSLPFVITAAVKNAMTTEQITSSGWTLVHDVLDLLRILSCKNVSLSPRDNDPKQVRRAIKRHGGNADSYRYHVLVVRPPGARSDAPGQEIGVMPRHVCRGHFSEYGPEFNKGLLFGKYSGRFFIPPHLKGDKKNGVVEKDYEVAAAESPEI